LENENMSDDDRSGARRRLLEGLAYQVVEYDRWMAYGHRPLCMGYQHVCASLVDHYVDKTPIQGDLARARDYLSRCPICWETIVETTLDLGGEPPALPSFAEVLASAVGKALVTAGEACLLISRSVLATPAADAAGARRFAFPGATLGTPEAAAGESLASQATTVLIDIEPGQRPRHMLLWCVEPADATLPAGRATLCFPRVEGGAYGSHRVAGDQTGPIRVELLFLTGSGEHQLVCVWSEEGPLDDVMRDWLAGPGTETGLLEAIESALVRGPGSLKVVRRSV
jgi:hypothetical protein